MNLFFSLDEFYFAKDRFNLRVAYPYNQVIIQKGRFSNFDIRLIGKNDFISFFGEGDMNSKNIISSKININASVLELMPQVFAAAKRKVQRVKLTGVFQKIRIYLLIFLMVKI